MYNLVAYKFWFLVVVVKVFTGGKVTATKQQRDLTDFEDADNNKSNQTADFVPPKFDNKGKTFINQLDQM